jgi:hypothetical protein
MIAREGISGSEDEHWLARARYHVRMEEYWRDRAMLAERELERLKLEFQKSKLPRERKHE